MPLQQHPNFGAALRLMGRDVRSVDLPGAAPVQIIRRFGMTFAPRGPIWTDETGTGARANALRALPLRLINSERSDPALHDAGFRQTMTAAHVAELPLTGKPDDRIARMRGKWRNSWRKASGQGLRFERTIYDTGLHQWLLDADTAQQKAKGYKALSHAVVLAYAVECPRDVIIFTARKKHDDVAAMLFLRHGMFATYHIGWTSPKGRKCSAHHALLIHAAESFGSDGLARLDLGTVDTEHAPGLARFKIGCGADVRPLGGTWLKLPGF
ncbi:GNAT family N-acetyltransferase [Yoonia sediminilitoris]|uniref:GNAT family N-acetyltransferase n=1 Tax=Yoonia sediminilitoris TaxID=1286148 RepID=UPI001FE9CE26|nr:GNAT family N-acetyltransferase [Yoonia sediminilitoris]